MIGGSRKPEDPREGGQQIAFEFPMEKTQPAESVLAFDVALMSLGCVQGLGHKGLRVLVEHYLDNLGAAWEAHRTDLADVLQAGKVPAAQRIAGEIDHNRSDLLARGERKAKELHAGRISVLKPSAIPSRLGGLPGRPWWLFVEGNPEALYQFPHVAVVGTRQPTSAGVKAAEAVLRTMAAYPITLISGLANGIDAAAHSVALRDGVQNVAFLGHGVNLTFPAETQDLRRRIVESGGAVVSEYLPDEHYRKQNFVQRNRLQAGLSDLVVGVEGKASGGTAHTVRFAVTYGRPLIGLKWQGSDDLVEMIEQQSGSEVLEIFSDDARRRLDERFRELAESRGHETYALRLVEILLAREARLRRVRRGDMLRLQSRISEITEA
jgi:DNA protecting protein DprA